MKNKEFPFFDTSVSNKVDFTNSISLLNLQSIKDFQNTRRRVSNKMKKKCSRGRCLIKN